MRKYCYKITMKIFPVYFTALVIAIVIFALFFGTQNMHAQTNEMAIYENPQSGSANLNAFSLVATSTSAFVDIIPDEKNDEMKFSFNSVNDIMQISVNKEVTNMVVYDLANNVVEDVLIDIRTKEINFSASCPGIYYVRVDYKGGSHLRRMVVQ